MTRSVLIALALVGVAYGQAPTGQQFPLPTAATKFPAPDKPRKTSPTLAEVSPVLASKPLTLNGAISVALSTNPGLAEASQNLYQAEGRVGEASAAFYPVLGVNPQEDYIKHVAAPAYIAAATLPIDISHLLGAALDQAHFQEVQARLDVNRVRNEIVYQVTDAFFARLRADALVSVATEDLQNTLDRQYDAQARYAVRAVAFLDVARAQTDVAASKRNVIQAQANVQTATANLANAMGIQITQNLTLDPTGATQEPPGVPPPSNIPPPADHGPIPPKPDGEGAKIAAQSALALTLGPEFENNVDEALQTRPEILEAQAGIAAAQKGVLIAQRSVLPSFSISAGYYDLRTQSGSYVNEPQAYVGLSIPIFEGGLARSRVQEARATVATAETNVRRQVDNVTLDVQQAYLGILQATEQVRVANQVLSAAKTAFDIAVVRYTTGVSSTAGISPLLEVSDAQAALTLAEQNQVNALYDYNTARAQLDRAVGRFAYVANAPGFASPPPPKAVGGTGQAPGNTGQ
jgi:outer membrane protein